MLKTRIFKTFLITNVSVKCIAFLNLSKIKKDLLYIIYIGTYVYIYYIYKFKKDLILTHLIFVVC